jgi:hypothetical protein
MISPAFGGGGEGGIPNEAFQIRVSVVKKRLSLARRCFGER